MSKLDEILAMKRREVEAARSIRPEPDLRAQLRDIEPPRGFLRALEAFPGIGLIAEVKKASPSEGVIRADFDPVGIGATYRRAGAQCLSVLTDEPYFQGDPENLRLAREASGLPCLRKDFIVDRYQIAESRALGADAILLIVAALSDGELRAFREEAESLGMDALVETHSEDEAERTVASGARLVGVNNRDLSTFKTDLATTERIASRLPEGIFLVSESALHTRADVERVARAGARAVLIGTAFCRSPDIEAKVHEVMGR